MNKQRFVTMINQRIKNNTRTIYETISVQVINLCTNKLLSISHHHNAILHYA